MTPPCATRRKARPLVILAGREYGTGSSRDWAAKGTMLLGVKAVIAESFERIHRSNLIGMGVVPLQFLPGQNAQSLGLTGREVFDISGLRRGDAQEVTVTATPGRASRSASRHVCASTRPRSASTTGTAASCSTCCGSWPRQAAPPDGLRRRRRSGAPRVPRARATRSWPCSIWTAPSPVAIRCCPTSWASCCAIRRACRGCWASCRRCCCSCCGGATTGQVKSAFIRSTLGGEPRAELEAWTARFVPRLLDARHLRRCAEPPRAPPRAGAISWC